MVTNQRRVAVNAFSTSMLGQPRRVVIEFRRIDNIEEARELLRGAESYIRHPGTIEALREVGIELEPGSGIYTYRHGDTIIMIALSVPQRGQEVRPRIDDLVFYLISVLDIEQ
jgi:hypothetical protein